MNEKHTDYTPSEYEPKNMENMLGLKGSVNYVSAITAQEANVGFAVTPGYASPKPLTKAITKDTNPKDAIGASKVPFSTVPAQVIAEIGLGMLEGSCKYGRHNYRVAGVRASVYYDAAFRHLISWWEGQDFDPDSGLNHIVKALASLTVLRDAMLNDKLNDDRPPPMKDYNWVTKLNETAENIISRFPNPVQPFTKYSKNA